MKIRVALFLGVFVAILAMDAVFTQPVAADGGGLLGGDSPLGLVDGGTEQPAAPPEQPAESPSLGAAAEPVLNLATNTVNSVGEALTPQQPADTSDAATQPAAGTSEALLGTTAQPLGQTIEPVVQAAAPVVQAVEPVLDAVVEPVVLAAEPVLDAVVEPVVLAAEPVLEAVVEPVVQAAAPVLDAVVEPVVLAAEPVLDAVVEPVVLAAEPVLDAVVEPVVQAAAPVLDAVVEPVVQTVAPVLDAVVEPVVQTVAPVLEAALPAVGTSQAAGEPLGTTGASFAPPGPLAWRPSSNVGINGDAIAIPDTNQSPHSSSNPVSAGDAGPIEAIPTVGMPIPGPLALLPALLATAAGTAGDAVAERTYSPPAAPQLNPLAFVAGSGALTAPGGGSSAFAAVLASSFLLALALVASKRVCLDALRLPSRGYAPLLPPG